MTLSADADRQRRDPITGEMVSVRVLTYRSTTGKATGQFNGFECVTCRHAVGNGQRIVVEEFLDEYQSSRRYKVTHAQCTERALDRQIAKIIARWV